MDPQYVILGCGYTGKRVAARLAARGFRVLATSRSGGAGLVRMVCEEPDSVHALRALLEPGCRVLYSIPTGMPLWAGLLRGIAARLVYLSTTGVYGPQTDIDEHTSPAPSKPRELRRFAEERAVHSEHWSWMILRPAAIYGPGRGVHVALAAGTHRLMGDGGNWVSRIHADDLAAIAEAALLSAATGAWPVADDEPCTAREIAAFWSSRLGLPMPPADLSPGVDDTRAANRRVDGRAVRALLGVTLLHPGYRG